MGITSSNDSNEELQIAARNNDKSTVKTLMSNKTTVKCVDSKTNRVSFNLYIPVYTVVYKSINLSIYLSI